MNDFYSFDPNSLSMSVKHLQTLLKTRNTFKDAKILRSSSQFLFLTRNDGKMIRLTGMMPELTSSFASNIVIDKLATSVLLGEINITQPETILASPETIKSLLSRHSKIVIKPIDSAHGNGITTDITTLDDGRRAINFAQEFSRTKEALAQEQLDSTTPETRVIVVGGKFVAAFSRIPAQVTGDGTHTVKELIAIENKTIRTAPYASDLAYIDEQYSDNYLKLAGIADQIPAPGEKVQVIKMCNIGRGGTVEDVTDSFPEEKKREAEKIATHLSLPVAGIDYLDDYVIEVNSNPSLYYPSKTRSDLGLKALLDYLEHI